MTQTQVLCDALTASRLGFWLRTPTCRRSAYSTVHMLADAIDMMLLMLIVLWSAEFSH